MARKRLRYAWALHFTERDPEIQALSGHDHWGWRLASEFAEDDRQRSRDALRDEHVERLTATELGARHGLSPVMVNRLIRDARSALFGPARSESGVYYRLRRKKDGHVVGGIRICAEEDCPVQLGPLQHGNRRYCHTHRGEAARVRRHRRNASRTKGERS